jgi:hypothetical protein
VVWVLDCVNAAVLRYALSLNAASELNRAADLMWVCGVYEICALLAAVDALWFNRGRAPIAGTQRLRFGGHLSNPELLPAIALVKLMFAPAA